MDKRKLQIVVGIAVAGGLLAATLLWHRKSADIGETSAGETSKGGGKGSGAALAGKGNRVKGEKGAASDFMGTKALGERLAEIDKETDDLVREDLLAALLRAIPLEDTARALDFLIAQEATPGNRELQTRLLRRWAEKTPKDAAEYASAKLSGKPRQDALKSIASVWAEKDSTEAIAWARNLKEEDRNLAFVDISYAMVGADPLKALELARELPATQSRDDLIAHIAMNWAVKDPSEAGKWAAQIPDSELRARIITGIAATWGSTDPAAAANLALTSLPAGRHQDDAVVGIVQRWVQDKPLDAAEWVVKFPEGNLRQTAMEEVVKLWTDKDLNEAGSWINSLPAGPSRDHAISAYVGKITTTHPETAALWAGKIADEGERFTYMERIGESWLGIDEPAAREWIGKSGLPDTTKERLLRAKTK